MKDDLSNFDWSQADAMTDEAVYSAALADPDAQPLTAEQMRTMRRVPQAKVVRRILKISQEEFAQRFKIPLGTLRDWEQGRKVPDAAAQAYLTVIRQDPNAVTKALKEA